MAPVWSIRARSLRTGRSIAEHEPTTLLRTASVGKVFLLLELAEQLASGELSGSELVDRRDVDPVHDSGLWQFLQTDELTLLDAARLVGSVSDNWATNALVHRVGLDAVQQRAARLSRHGSTMHDVVRDHRGPDDPPTLSEGSADDWVDILSTVHADATNGDPVATNVVDWLSSGTDLSMVAQAFDLDPLSHGSRTHEGVALWNKTGTDDGVRADVGVVTGTRDTVVYAALCAWDPQHDVVREVLASMRGLGEIVRRAVG